MLRFEVSGRGTLVNVKAPVVATTNWWWLISALVVAENGGKGKQNLYLLT